MIFILVDIHQMLLQLIFKGNKTTTIHKLSETKSAVLNYYSLYAAKMLSLSSGRPMDVKLEQEYEDAAFFATRSNVQGDSIRMETSTTEKIRGLTDVEILERRIERMYLGSNSGIIGDGVKAGYDILHNEERVEDRHYRLQCYRSSGVLDEKVAPSHIRMYFLQKPNYVNPSPSEDETDINLLADKRFLQRAGDTLKSIYQRIIIEAASQMVPAFDTEMWQEPDGSKMVRFVIGYKVGATHSYFSGLADVYRAHGLFSSRKYVEYFSNGIVVHGFYLQQLDNPCRGCGTFEERIKDCVTDASMHFVLPRTSLTPMLRNDLLSPQEVSYGKK